MKSLIERIERLEQRASKRGIDYLVVGTKRDDDGALFRAVLACGRQCLPGCTGRDMAGCREGNI